MCAYLAILWLKIISNKSIEPIELSKIPRDIWVRVALSEIIPRTDYRRGDVVQRSPISRSYLGYWAYRIYIYIYYVCVCSRTAMDIFFIGQRGWRLPVKPYFFPFFISHSQHCLKMCVSCCWWNQLSIFEHIFYSNTSLAFPKFIK